MNTEQTTYSAVLGVVLANLRKTHSVEQNDMAARMGLSQASYSRLEGGKSVFSLDQMFLASDALGVSGEEISQRLNNTIAQLRAHGVAVVPHVRGNTTHAKEGGLAVGQLLAGAALGALLIGLLSKK